MPGVEPLVREWQLAEQSSEGDQRGQFSLDVPVTVCDNSPAMPVVACDLHRSNCLNRHTGDAFLLPGLVQQ
jgi:hypothetical protein